MDHASAAEATSGLGEPSLHDLHGHDHKSSLAFRTISEVSEEIDVPQHVLRFWESKFSQIRPLKRGGGRRYYRPEDIELLRRIKNFLYKQGYTIKGVQRLLREKRDTAASAGFVPYASPAASLPGYSAVTPAAPLVTSYLQAAAAAPSAMAMAYGSIGSQIGDQIESSHGRFGDAFEEATLKVVEEEFSPTDQLEKSLAAITQMHEEIAAEITPIRIINPAAPRLEDMPEEAAPAAREPEFNFENGAAVMQAQGAEAAETFAEDEAEFNQDIEDEELPVKRLDTLEVEEEEYASRVMDEEDDAKTAEHAVSIAPVPGFTDEKRQELKGILAEMMALRDMLQAGAA